MVQCIINIILPIISSVVQPGQPSVSLCAGGWWCVGRGRYSGAGTTQQCQLQLWTGTPLITTMALKLITLALTALVLVQVGHSRYSHSNLQYQRPLCEEN